MKKPVLLTDTAGGRRLRDISQSEIDAMVRDGEAVHVRGNLYQTKVMRADASQSCAGQKLATLEAEAAQIPAPEKKKRGRPRLRRDDEAASAQD